MLYRKPGPGRVLRDRADGEGGTANIMQSDLRRQGSEVAVRLGPKEGVRELYISGQVFRWVGTCVHNRVK
jgi:hypothetical protein